MPQSAQNGTGGSSAPDVQAQYESLKTKFRVSDLSIIHLSIKIWHLLILLSLLIIQLLVIKLVQILKSLENKL